MILSDILSAFLILIYLLAISFAWFLPLKLYLKSAPKALLTAIPISLSWQIIIGYVFYNLEKMAYFPFFYFGLIILINIIAAIKLKKTDCEKINWRYDKFTLISILIILPALLYTRYFDAMSFVAPGNSDTINHLFFLNSIDEIGRIGLSYYAPGFQIIVYPLTKLFSSLNIYRFAGVAIGTTFALQLLLFFRQHTKNKPFFLLATALFLSPIYTQLTLQTISFWSSSLSFVFLLGIIHLVIENNVNLNKRPLLYLIIVTGLSFTVPYLFIQLVPAFALFFIIYRLARRFFNQENTKAIPRFFIILIIGLVLAFGHIILQAKLSDSSRIVPTIRMAIKEDNEVRVATSRNVYVLYPGLQKYEKHPLFVKILPTLSIMIDLGNVKNIRGLSSILDIGSYIWLLISLLLVFYASKKKSLGLLIIATLSLIFGIITQTGILELSYYRGRSGWYLMLFSLLGLILFLETIKLKKPFSEIIEKTAYLGAIVLIIFSFISPPTFYRKYYPQIYKLARDIGKNAGDKTVVFYNNSVQETSLPMVRSNIENASLEDFLSGKKCYDKNKQYYVILEKNPLDIDPKLSQSALSTDKEYKHFYKEQQELHDKKSSIKNQVLKSENLSNYNLFYDDKDITIYKLER